MDNNAQSIDRPNDPGNHSAEKNNDCEINASSIDRQGSQSSNMTPPLKQESRPWKKSFCRLAPLAGMFCLLLVVASMITALGILIGSRNAATSSWSVPPSTYLAICTAVANQALRFAAFQGLVVAWWWNAMRGGTVAQLHRNWRSGMTLHGAFLSGRHMGFIGIACIGSTFVAIDGPFLQKASTIALAAIVAQPVTLQVDMAQEIPTDLTGAYYTVPRSQRWSINFNATIPTVNGTTSNLIAAVSKTENPGVEWFSHGPVINVVQGCPEEHTCKATVRAPALAVTACESHVLDIDYWQPLKNVINVEEFTDTSPPLSTLAFIIDIALVTEGEYEYINLITGYDQNVNCTGTFNYQICSLQSAIGEYDVLVTGNETELISGHPRIVALANNTKVSRRPSLEDYEKSPSTLGGIVELAWEKWESTRNYFVTKSGGPYGTGAGYSIYTHFADLKNSDGHCYSYLDPFSEVVGDLNRLMFRIGRGAATGAYSKKSAVESLLDPGLPIHTTTQGHLHGQHEVFKTNLHWFAAAAVVELVCVALVLPTFFGWWTLGRPVSFSPLEIAKAFEAPLLADCNSNASGNDIGKAVGDVRVQYGQTSQRIERGEAIAQSKLTFADPAIVCVPQTNARFD